LNQAVAQKEIVDVFKLGPDVRRPEVRVIVIAVFLDVDHRRSNLRLPEPIWKVKTARRLMDDPS
jgi:hypothetical protein